MEPENSSKATMEHAAGSTPKIKSWEFELSRIPTEVAQIANTLKAQDSVNRLRDSTQPQALSEPLRSHSLGLPRFASRKNLDPFIPGADPENERARTFRVRMSKRSTMLYLQLSLALIVLFANIGFTVWATRVDGPQNGTGTLFHDTCDLVARWNTGAHVILNVVASLFLGAGNYCMQILVAPKPDEVKKQHALKGSFDIGIHSIHNLRNIHAGRKLLWFALGILSTALHLIWNSAIFPSIPFTEFPVAIVTEDHLAIHEDWAVSRPGYFATETEGGRRDLEALQTKAQHFNYVNNTQCIQVYIDSLEATSELVLVTNETSSAYNGSSLVHAWFSGSTLWEGSTMWVCATQYDGHGSSRRFDHYCTEEWARSFEGDWTFHINPWDGNNWGIDKTVFIDHCLMGETAGPGSPSRRCGLHYNLDLLLLITVMAAFDAGIIAYVAMTHQDRTLVLMGDAIAHFLETKSSADQSNLETGHPEQDETTKSNENLVHLQEGHWSFSHPRWSSAVSKRTWAYSLCVFAAGILLGLTMLCFALIHLRRLHISIKPSSLAAHGLGRTRPHSIVGGLLSFPNKADKRINSVRAAHVIVANSFQVMISFLYLFYNNILTRQVVADEMLRFLRRRKGLRVSSPTNITQRSSHFLSLPWKYAAFQMGAFMVLHWLVSQSIFTVQTRAHGPGPDGSRKPNVDTSRLGFSTIGIILSVGLGGILTCALVLNSYRSYSIAVPEDFPLMATNSAATEANCYGPVEDEDAYLYPIQLGVVKGGFREALSPSCKGRVVFSSDVEIQKPTGGETYEFVHWTLKERMG